MRGRSVVVWSRARLGLGSHEPAQHGTPSAHGKDPLCVRASTSWSPPLSPPSSLVAATLLTTTSAQASPADDYTGPYYGDGNLPPGCIKDMSRDNPANICYHGKLGLNALDSPQIDVAVLVPVSPTAERDMRIMRQAVQSWEGGIDYLSGEMGLDWLQDGVDFHVTVDSIDLTGENGGELTTYPLYDPEIVVIATNPVGGIGIGVDPTYLTSELGIFDENGVPCHNVENPFDVETWEAMPGFDSHHDTRGGTYVEDCGGAGGNVCFSVNGAIDPVPGVTDTFSLYDLVLHETGHCLTLGHVGDGAEGAWGPVPDDRHHGLQRRPAGPEQVRLDAQRGGVRGPDEPLPRRRRQRRGHRGRRARAQRRGR